MMMVCIIILLSIATYINEAHFSSAVTVQMERAVYQVSEDEGSVDVCALMRSPPGVDCPVDFSVYVPMSTSDDSAGT